MIFIAIASVFMIACTNTTTEIKKTNSIDSSGSILGVSNETCLGGKEIETDSFNLFQQFVYSFLESSKILASSMKGDTILIVDEYYEDGACDGPSYHVTLIPLNKTENILIHKLECNTRNNFKSFLMQEDTLMGIFKRYTMRPMYDSISRLSREKTTEIFNIYDSFSTYESEGTTYIKEFSIHKDKNKLLTVSYNEERKILDVVITGAIFFQTSKYILIQYNEKQEWESGDTEGFSNYRYILIGI